MTVRITDSVRMSDALIINDQGYLETSARTARIGIQQYLGSELGKPSLGVINVYRDESEVFKKSSLDTFSKLPMTVYHPAQDVNAENWKDLAVGTTGDEVLRDGEYLKIGIKITDASAVDLINKGTRELSVGYSAEIEWVDGIAPDGTPYQAVQKNIKANHIAIVDAGRAGSKARIGDSWGASPVTPINDGGLMADTLKTIVLGDAAVQVSAADAAAVEQFKTASAKQLADAISTHDAAIAAKDAELATLQAKLDDATAKILTDADIDAKVAARADLVALAKSIAPGVKTDGIKDSEIRKAVVVAKIGDASVAGKSDAYVDARFDILAESVKSANPVADAIGAGLVSIGDDDADSKKSYDSYLARLTRKNKEA